MKKIYSLAFAALATNAAALDMTKFKQEVKENNYFSNSPATFISTCKAADCATTFASHTGIDMRERVDATSIRNRERSIKKHITSTLILLLVEDGYLSLEDELVDYLPQYPKWKGITIKNLLMHSSGIPSYLFSPKGIRNTALEFIQLPNKDLKPSDLVADVYKQPLTFKTGTKSAYNNTNYVLLGMIAETATGTSAAVLLDRYIFAPLGMKNTYRTSSSQSEVKESKVTSQ